MKEVSADGVDSGLSKWVEDVQQKSERPDLSSASIVVSGGRALKSKENFKIIEQLADKLGAAGRLLFFLFLTFAGDLPFA